MIHSKTRERLRRARLAAALLLAASNAAEAGEPARDPASAEALFRAGRELVEKGDWRAGCPKLEAAMAAMPTASTLLNIARCHEHEGKVATAWADTRRALILNRETVPEERRRALEEKALASADELEKRLPRLRIEADKRYPGLVVERDGQALPGDGVLDQALPVDPGEHEITASAPGFSTFHATVRLEEGKTAVASIALVVAPPEPPQPSAPGVGTGPVEAPKETALRSDAQERRAIPVWVWFAGAAGLGMGAAAVAFRVDGAAAESTLVARCGAALVCDATKFDASPYNARKNRDLGLTIGFAAGGVLAASAAVVGIALAPIVPVNKAIRVSPAPLDRGGGLVISGAY